MINRRRAVVALLTSLVMLLITAGIITAIYFQMRNKRSAVNTGSSTMQRHLESTDQDDQSRSTSGPGYEIETSKSGIITSSSTVIRLLQTSSNSADSETNFISQTSSLSDCLGRPTLGFDSLTTLI